MLRFAFPKAHQKYCSLPLLGPIADGFDDWLAASGFTPGSRKLAINLLPVADKKLRLRGVDEVAKLNHAVLDDCCQAMKRKYPCRAGTIHTLERYLVANRLIVDGHQAAAQPSSLSDEYAEHLREVRGFAASTISSQRRAAQEFLQHLEEAGTAVGCIAGSNIESYIAQAGKRLSRGSLQHDIAALRGLLRFLSINGRAPAGLDRQIDTPRLYRLEQLPKELPASAGSFLESRGGSILVSAEGKWAEHNPWVGKLLDSVAANFNLKRGVFQENVQANVCIVDYNDGSKAAVIAGRDVGWTYAVEIEGQKEPTIISMLGWPGPYAQYHASNAQPHWIAEMMVTKKEPFNAERLLLSTGITNHYMESNWENGRYSAVGRRIETAVMNISYRSTRGPLFNRGPRPPVVPYIRGFEK